MNPVLLNFVQPRPVHAQKPATPLFAGKKDKKEDASQGSRPLVIEGRATAKRWPDVMNIFLSIKEEGKDHETVDRTLSQRAAALFEAVKALALPFETAPTYNVQEKTRYNRQTGEQTVEGYQGTYQLNLEDRSKDHTVFPDHANAVKQVAGDQQANFHGPSYSLSSERYLQAQDEANSKALKRVRRSAQRIARDNEFNLNQVPLEVIVGAPNTYQPMSRGARAFAATAEAAFAADAGGAGGAPQIFDLKPIEVGSQQVTAVFHMEQPQAEAADTDADAKKAKKAQQAKLKS